MKLREIFWDELADSVNYPAMQAGSLNELPRSPGRGNEKDSSFRNPHAYFGIHRLVFKWILHLEEEIPFPLQHDEIQVSDVLKSSALRFEDNNEELLKTAETYIKICADLLKTKLIICVGIHNCFSMKEIDMLYRTAEYENISILDIERYEPDQYHPLEKSYIIDNDFCEIYNES